MSKAAAHFAAVLVPGSIINMISGVLSIHLGPQGQLCHRYGLYPRVLIASVWRRALLPGGVSRDARGAETGCGRRYGAACAARALSTRNDEPTKASRPDKDRDGFVFRWCWRIGAGRVEHAIRDYSCRVDHQSAMPST
jgi:hypothetical protein